MPMSTLRKLDGAALRRRIAALYAALTAATILVWALALLLLRGQPVLLGTALLAYGLGLRHAVDADHIAAIDNVTRKLMSHGERPIGVGLFFAAGHSSIVVLASIAAAGVATALIGSTGPLRVAGGVISTSVSAFFLFAVAAVNLLILRGVWRSLKILRRGGPYVEEDLDILLNSRGLLARLFKPLFRLVTKSWHMVLLGFLFGLGFDTASEVALLGMTAMQGASGISLSTLIILPGLFAVGMTLVDTTDGILMLGAYNWALASPARKLTYNLAITLVSVLVALLIGGVEVLNLVSTWLDLGGGAWDWIDAIGRQSTAIGFGTIGVFILIWAESLLVHRFQFRS